ncbi:MAG: ATP-binding cassette domain-containing protein [Nitrospira sp.]|jgi:ABC-type bacteriocin/lantibiotic exporter with double-glycine peptidase domain|nr:ATP-binding cassette domain-containing protein [Nitrospira sp.]MBS0173279.1 ATP-binding cassette domain-containing protein [Nitrospira sp.]MBS0177675.1 ATP-binding cassette domain-containing protein [Nitrospira sp.]MBX3336842.1 ATP-binding cassette domain-containing protein [Nitrospira sp.]MCW5779410.1 ATP-binding cassette domain-containing protein [Nitrospira sp.]
MAQDHSGNQSNMFQTVVGHLGLLFRLERRILGLIGSYSIAIGLFSLIVPLTVQELVNTFAFALQPITIVTLAAVMVAGLLFVGAFRALQYYAVEVLERRIFARVAIAMAQQLPHLRYQGFKPRFANYFMETILMQRAVSVLLVDLINVIVGGAVGMTILVFYHPYFLLYNAILLLGFNVVFFLMSHGGLKADLDLSHAKYDTLHWFQEIAYNLLHLKSTDSQALLIKKTDQLLDTYVDVRKTRFGILIRQYLGSLGWQAIAHSGLIATAGWLLGIGQLTLGQFVAAEVVVSGILSSFDGVVKRMGHIYYFLTALTELGFLFSLPKDQDAATLSIPLPDPTVHGIRVTSKDLTFAPAGGPAIFENFNLEITPGEKIGIYTDTTMAKTALARVLGGLETPTSGVIRYNGVDLRHLNLDSVNRFRGFILDSQLSLFEGTLEENIVLGRDYIPYSDVRWALRFTELEEEVDALPHGLKTQVRSAGKIFAPTHIVRILVARAILGHPQLLIFEGILHNMHPATRETILRRLCSKEEPWSVIFVSNDPNLTPHVDRRIMLN